MLYFGRDIPRPFCFRGDRGLAWHKYLVVQKLPGDAISWPTAKRRKKYYL